MRAERIGHALAAGKHLLHVVPSGRASTRLRDARSSCVAGAPLSQRSAFALGP
jgi:hypothetical protein